MNLKNSFFWLLLASFALVSCDEKRVFDQYKSVGDAWHKDSIVTFDVEKLDNTKKYNLFVNIRDNDNYPFSNLFLIVAMEHPNGFTKVDTLEYQMTNPDGSLLGNGSLDIKESKLFLKENITIKTPFKIKIKQALRENGKITGVTKLDGITEVGFRIENSY